MTPEQAKLVRLSFVSLLDRKVETGKQFYQRLFAIAPDTRAMFKDDIDAQAGKLMDTLSLAIATLRDPPALVEMLDSLARRHVSYGVRQEHYEQVGAALLWTLEKSLGDGYTPEVKTAWTELYKAVSTVMRSAAYGDGAANHVRPGAALAAK